MILGGAALGSTKCGRRLGREKVHPFSKANLQRHFRPNPTTTPICRLRDLKFKQIYNRSPAAIPTVWFCPKFITSQIASMKRKLNENDVPEEVEEIDATAPTDTNSATEPPKAPEPATFASFDLEPRLLRGIRDQRWSAPTPVQARAIPLALEGKDILARSGTGTGKTAAYLLPILHNTIRRKDTRATSALILVPTKELALQVTKLAQSLSTHCGQDVRIQNIAGKESDVVQRAKLAELPDIVVATPARASINVNNGALSLKGLAHLVIDEGDLVMGYGFQEDLDNLSKNMEKGVQIL
jgi:ATP-dependent RNA helicase DDX56/DBP9